MYRNDTKRTHAPVERSRPVEYETNSPRNAKHHENGTKTTTNKKLHLAIYGFNASRRVNCSSPTHLFGSTLDLSFMSEIMHG